MVNIVLAALFFFFIPTFGIAPKTTLVIYLFVSFFLVSGWRFYLFPALRVRKRERALLISGGGELKELYEEVNNNSRYRLEFVAAIDVETIDGGALSDRLFAALKNSDITAVVANAAHPKLVNILPHLYKPILSNVRFIDANEMYEEIFDRVPLSSLKHSDFFESVSAQRFTLYPTLKRLIDILGSLLFGLVVCVLTPFIFLAIKLEDGGPALIVQDRVGQHRKPIKTYKFRTMTSHDPLGKWVAEGGNKITTVGHLLRKTSLDEYPQVYNVLKGEMSLIGPRSDIVGIDKRVGEAIPSNEVRYLIKPGISGWAQVKQLYREGHINPQSVEEMKMRLGYDLYYLKNRSLWLDILIAVRTLRIVFAGRPGM